MVYFSVLVCQREAAAEVHRLLGELCPVLAAMGKPYEVIAVDDGSIGPTRGALARLMTGFPCLRVLCLDRASGLGAALEAGIRAAGGEVLIAIEPGGRYRAVEVVRLVARLARADAVFGCRRLNRPARLARRLAQCARRMLGRHHVRDPGCLLWAARAEAVSGLPLARRGYRLLPALVAQRGYRVGELHVDQLPRAPAGKRLNKQHVGAAWWRPTEQPPPQVHELAPAPAANGQKLARIDQAQSPLGRASLGGAHDEQRNRTS